MNTAIEPEPKVYVRVVPPAALDLVHEFERMPGGSYAATAYIDRGVPCIGWGHRIFSASDPLLHKTIDATEADTLADADLKSFALDLCRELGEKTIASLSEGQYAALIDFVFNLGFNKFLGSTLHRMIVAGDLKNAADEFPRWVYVGKVVSTWLIKRRAAERALWMGSPSS